MFGNLKRQFHFNGKENDNEVKGAGNSQDYGARIYDPRLGRWLSRDPEEKTYSSWSTYNAFMCNPIVMIDPTGKGGIVSLLKNKETGATYLKVTATIYIYKEANSPIDMDAVKKDVETNIESIWNNKSKPFQALIPGNDKSKDVVFEVNVIVKTKEEVTEMVNDNKIVKGDNLVKIVDGGGSQIPEGNSGWFDVSQHAGTGSTYAHEFGHLLNYLFKGTPGNGGKYHNLEEKTPVPIMSTGTKQSQRQGTQSDVDGLDGGKGVGNKNVDGVNSPKTIGADNDNKVY